MAVTDPTPVPAEALTRRSFLRRVGLGAAAALVVADGALAYRAYDQGVLAEGDGPAFDAWSTWRDHTGPEALVAAAVLAASAHNTQPWAFTVADDRIEVWADAERTTGANDPLGREHQVSLGCALENLLLAAPAQGLDPVVELVPGPPDLVASVAVTPVQPVVPDLHDAIGDRHSNRSDYRADPVPVAARAAMADLATPGVGSARLVWLVDADDRRRFADLLVDAARAHTADEAASRDSFAWWRSSWDEIQRHKDGLTIDGVGLRPVVRSIAKVLPAPSRAEADRTFLERTEAQARTAPAFGVIVVDDPEDQRDRLRGGRLLQRLHLWASAHHLGFQHMNQVTERIDRDRSRGRRSPYLAPLADLVGPGALCAFRVGTPTVAALPSPRRPVEEVVR